MTEYSRMAKGNFTATGTTALVVTPFQPDYVELWNYSNIKTKTNTTTLRSWWDNNLIDGTVNPTMLEIYTTTSAIFDQIQTGGISTFSAGSLLQYGPTQQVVSATAANPIVFTVTGHGYNVGDTVIFENLYQSPTTGMPQIDGMPFTISAVTTNTFTILWNGSTSQYTALSGSPSGATVKKVLFPWLYLPGVNFVSALTLAATTTVVTTTYHNFEVGQEVAFRIPSVNGVSPPAWGPYQLNSLPNPFIPGQPIYGYVTSITDNWTFVVNINSTGYTAYNADIPVAKVAGLNFPQVLAVGDVNTGGNIITATSPLYPSPQFPTSSSRIPTINGPAIRGAYVNNTAQGFVIGSGASANNSVQIMASGNIMYWHAYLHDYGKP